MPDDQISNVLATSTGAASASPASTVGERVASPPVTRWQPDRTPKVDAWPMPTLGVAVLRGVRGLCPVCGKGHLFRGFLRVVDNCSSCAAPLGRVRADDLPPYMTIFVVGHVVVGGMLWLEKAETPPLWVHTVIWVPLTIVLSLALIRPLKGVAVGLMMKLGMMKTDEDG